MLSALLLWAVAAAAQPAPPSPTNAPAPETALSAETRRSLQLQEQLHAAQLALEFSRQESETSSLRNTELLNTRLQLIEQTLAGRQNRELEALQSTNRLLLLATAFLGAVALLSLGLLGLLFWHSLKRLTETTAQLSSLHQENLLLAKAGESLQPPADPSSSSRLLAALDELERRLHQLEQPSRRALGSETAPLAPPPPALDSAPNGEPAPDPLASSPLPRALPDVTPAPVLDPRVLQALVQGQMHLDSQNPQLALQLFEQALALAPGHAELLAKKGIALEKLQRPQEALECLDRALVQDPNLTMAYLHKGGILNRVGRFSEALHCYERALQTQEQRGPQQAA